MKNITNNTKKTRTANGGWTRCRVCNKNVYGNWWTKYTHCLGHAVRCLPWMSVYEIMKMAFGL